MSHTTDVETTQDRQIHDDRRFFGHPVGLATLFSVELWERFSYYGMRAILLYFIIATVEEGGLGIDPTVGQAVVSTYGASVYLLSVVGGWAADRIMGARRATLYGGVVIMLGHVLLAVPSPATSWIGIVAVALGTGFLKPNVSTLVGRLYRADDDRRDAAFSIFYMSINIGSFIAPFVVGFLRSIGGFHLGFLAAAIGMALALVSVIVGRRFLTANADDVANPLGERDRKRLPLFALGIIVGAVVLFFVATMRHGLFSQGLTQPVVIGGIIDGIGITSVVTAIVYFVVMFRSKEVTKTEKRHLTAYLPMWLGAVLFWMIFEQAASKLAAFAADRTDLHIFGLSIEPEFFQSINPLTVIIMAPVLAVVWVRLAGRFPSTAQKFSIGVLLAGLSFVILAICSAAFPGASSPWWVLTVVYVVQTIGELCLSPVGLSATTRMAPRAFASQAMALWFLASAVGQSIAAQAISGLEAQEDTVFFWILGGIAVVFAIVLFCMSPWIRSHMADVELTQAVPVVDAEGPDTNARSKAKR